MQPGLPRDVSDQSRRGVLGRVPAILVLRGQHAHHDRPGGRFNDSRIGPHSRHRPGLVSHHGPLGQVPRNPLGALTRPQMLKHLSRGSLADGTTTPNRLQQIGRLGRRCAAQAKLLASLRINRRFTTKDLGVDPRVGMSQPRHRTIGRLQPNVIQDQVGRGVVRDRDHQTHSISQGQS